MQEDTKIAVFKGKKIRKTLHQNEWWFSVVDVCGILSESADAGAYWRKLKQRLSTEGSEVVTFCHGLKLEAPDGKKYARASGGVSFPPLTHFSGLRSSPREWGVFLR